MWNRKSLRTISQRHMSHIGIDVGADRLHAVALDDAADVLEARIFGPEELTALVSWSTEAQVIAIDAPAMLSTAPHKDDPDISAKFRLSRCADIALGRVHKIWVPWATPTAEQEVSSWIRKGLEVFERLSGKDSRVVEVFPHAAFVRLAGGRIPSKKTVAGLNKRAELLESAGVKAPWLSMWSHDSLDAAVSAVVALRVHEGAAVKASCEHDDSAIWLP